MSIENKVCGRFGGDELALFAIVDTDLAEQVKEEIKDKMAELNRRSGKSYVLSVSVGAAVAPVETSGLTMLCTSPINICMRIKDLNLITEYDL